MLYISIFDAKDNVSLQEINRERDEWFKKEKDKVFQQMCKKIERYEIVGKFPLRIVFLIETDDPHALNILSHHFGEGWSSTTYPVIKRELYEAMEEDRSIIGG